MTADTNETAINRDAHGAFRPVSRFGTRSPLVLFVGCYFIYFAYGRGYISILDVQERYHITNQMWYHGTVHPNPDYAAENPELFTLNDDGKYIAYSGLGQSMSMLPAAIAADLIARLLPSSRSEAIRYQAGQFIFKTFCTPLFATLTLVAVYILALRLGCGDHVGRWGAFALGFATYWPFYAKSAFLNLEIAMWLTWALVLAGGPRKHRLLSLLGTGCCLGITLLYRPEFIVPVSAILLPLILCARGDGRRAWSRLFLLCVPVIAMGCVVLWHNELRTGSLVSSGSRQNLEASGVTLWADFPGQHLLQLFFGSVNGYFWYNPILLCIIPVLFCRSFYRRSAMVCGAIVVAIYCMLIASINFSVFDGGYGSRYLVPITPFLVLGVMVGVYPLLSQRRLRRVAAAGIVTASVFQIFLCFDDHHTPVIQNRILARQVMESKRHTQLGKWRTSILAGRLRNLGVPIGDPPGVAEIWQSDEIQNARWPISDNLWWLKLAGMTASSAMRCALVAIGLVIGIYGFVLVFVALVPPVRGAAGR